MHYPILYRIFIVLIIALHTALVSAHNFGGNSTGSGLGSFLPENGPVCQKEGSTSQSVRLYDGREIHQVTDMVVKGVYPIEISRKYDSRGLYDSTLGYGWSFTTDRKIYAYPDGSVLLRSECGRRDKFIQVAGAFVTPKTAKRGTLTLQPDGSYQFFYVNGTRDIFDQQGRLVSIEKASGIKQVLTYDSRGRLPLTGTSPFSVDPTKPMVVARLDRLQRIEVQLADSTTTGQYVDFTYNESTGRVTKVTDNTGRSVTYTHDVTTDNLTKGNLEAVTTPSSMVYSYKYEDPFDDHNVTTITRGTGATPQVLVYDDQDRATKETYGNNVIDIVYNGDLTTTTTTTVTDESGLNPRTFTQHYEFDTDTYITLYRNAAGHEKRYTYDPGHKQVTREELWEKTVTGLTLFSATDYTYDTTGNRLTKEVQPTFGENITWTWTYDQNRVTQEDIVASSAPAETFQTIYTYYYTNGFPTTLKTKQQRNFDNSMITTQYGYDAQGRNGAITLPDGTERVFGFYPTNGRVKDVSYRISGALSPYKKVTIDYDTKGNINQVWDAKNNVTKLTYNNINRLTQVENAKNEVSTVSYDERNNIQQIERGRLGASTGKITKLIYDGKNQLTKIIKVDDFSSEVNLLTLYYDSEGNRVKTVDANGNATNYEYNLLNQLVKVTDAKLNVTQYEYDAAGNRNKTIDAKSNETDYTYDRLNRLISTVQKGVTPNLTAQFNYNALGQVRKVTDPKAHDITYEYDGLGRLLAEVKTLGQRIEYTYDDRNRLNTKTNSRGQQIRYGYEAWGALSTAQYFNAVSDTTPTYSQLYGYDYQGNLTTLSDDRIQSTPLYNSTYDAINRLKTQDVQYIPGGTRQLQYGYDAVGNRKSLTLIDGASTLAHTYNYNKLNQLTESNLPENQLFKLSYYLNNNLKQIQYPHGLLTDIGYESNNDVKQIKLTNAGAVLEQFDYGYDPAGNILSIDNLIGQQGMGYDGLNRLTNLTQPTGSPITDESYTYDEIGNRELISDAAAYDYDNNNRITKSPALGYTFDNDGNLSSRSDGMVYTHDINNRLETISKTTPSTNANYAYDPTGRRINKTVNGKTTWFLWDSSNVLAEYDNSGQWQKRYSYLPQYYTPVQMTEATGTYFVHLDHLGSPRLITANNANQDLVWKWDSDAFGKTAALEDVDGNAQNVTFNFRFPGQYYDVETGLHYNYYRYYDPSTGRYTRSDPIGLLGGLNTYGYVFGNPIKNYDPNGLLAGHVLAFLAIAYTIYDMGSDANLPPEHANDGIVESAGPGDLLSGFGYAGLKFGKNALGSLSRKAPKQCFGSTPKGRPLTKHYELDTGPKRNIPGTVVDNTIDTTKGLPIDGGKTVHYDSVNDVTVVTGDGGSIVSAHKGKPRGGQF